MFFLNHMSFTLVMDAVCIFLYLDCFDLTHSLSSWLIMAFTDFYDKSLICTLNYISVSLAS